MVTVIGKDNSKGKDCIKMDCKCNDCGTFFNATLDEFTLVSESGLNFEYRLKIKCPECDNTLFYCVSEGY